MPRRARGDEAGASRQFLRGADAHAGHARTLESGGAALGDRELGVDGIEVLAHHEIDACSGGVGLLGRFGEEDHVAIQQHAAPLEQQHGHEVRRQHRLVVLGAAAPDVAVLQIGSERIHRPLLALHRHHVRVRQDQQRPLRPVALQPRHQVGAVGVLGERLRGDAFGLEHLLQVVDDQRFTARRAVDTTRSR